MRILHSRMTRLATLACIAIITAGCEESMGPGGNSAFQTSPLFNATVMQVDRFGLPAINTAFVSADADKNVYNQAVPANDDQFLPVASGVIQARYGLTQAEADALADFALPDVQPLGDLSGFPNGRRLQDDVIDVELGLIFGVFGPANAALDSDGVDANDVAFLSAFPYLAGPN